MPDVVIATQRAPKPRWRSPSWPPRARLSPLALLCCAAFAQAQNLDTALPPAVDPQVPAGSPALEAFSRGEIPLGGLPGETEILPVLHGIVLLGGEADLQRPAEPGFHPGAIRNLAGPEARDVASAHLGAPLTQESLARLTRALESVLALQGRPFSIVYAPPQDVTEGVLRLVVRESRAGVLRLEGNRWFSDASYLDRLGLREGGGIDLDTLREGIARINANPFRQVSLSVAPGTDELTSDFVLRASEARPLRFSLSTHNQGTPSTGEDRLTAGVDWGNVFGSGHRLSAQWTSDPEGRFSRALSMTYQADLPRGHGLLVSAVYSRVTADLPATFDQQGTSWQIGAQYRVPLRRPVLGFNQEVALGADLKSSDNNLSFVAPPIVLPVTDTLTRIAQLRAGWHLDKADALGTTGIELHLVYSPGNLLGHNDDEAFDWTRGGAQARYAYAALSIQRDLHTPSLPGFLWSLRLDGQLASGNLLPSEQFAAGGFHSVRGYDEGLIIGDDALALRQEWQFDAPPLPDGWADNLSLYLFHDIAATRSRTPLPGEDGYRIEGAGLGARWVLPGAVSLEAAYGWPLQRPDDLRADGSGRFHFSSRLVF